MLAYEKGEDQDDQLVEIMDERTAEGEEARNTVGTAVATLRSERKRSRAEASAASSTRQETGSNIDNTKDKN